MSTEQDNTPTDSNLAAVWLGLGVCAAATVAQALLLLALLALAAEGHGLALAVLLLLSVVLPAAAVVAGSVVGAGAHHVAVREAYMAAGLAAEQAEQRTRWLLRRADPAALLVPRHAAVAVQIIDHPPTSTDAVH